MKIEGVSARDFLKNAYIKASEIYKDFFISDAQYIDFNKDFILCVSYNNKRRPFIYELLKDSKVNNYIKSFNKICLLLIEENSSFFIDEHQNHHQIPHEIHICIIKCIHELDDFGGVLNDKNELVINLKSKRVGPHYDVNLLLGDRTKFAEPLLSTPKSVVNSFGFGSFRGDSNYQVLATRWDIRPEENGNPFNRQFYLLENSKIIFYSGAVSENIKEAYCVHGVNKTEIFYKTEDLEIKRTIFIMPQRKGLPTAVESQLIEIKNLNKLQRNLEIVCTGMFGLSNPSCQEVDIIYQTVITQSKILKINDNIAAIVPDYYPNYFKDHIRFATIKDDEGFFEEFTQDSTSFLGNGNFSNPEGINSFDNALRMSGSSFFALKKKFTLKPKESHNFIEFVGCTMLEDSNDIYLKLNSEFLKLISEYYNYEKVLKELERKTKDFNNYKNYLQIKSNDNLFDSYVNNTLPFQVLYQTFVSRSFAQTQKGYREIGFREIQDLYGSLPYLITSGQEVLAEKLLTKWIENIFEFGYANHNFYYKGKEPGMCSDDQIWLLDAVFKFATLTNNKGFLNKKFRVAGKRKKRKLIDTLKAIVLYSSEISVGKHGLPLLDSADWNDCLKIDDDYLNGPEKEKVYLKQLKKNGGKFGDRFVSNYSESIMNAFLLLNGMKNLLLIIDDEDFKKTLNYEIEKMTDAVNKSAYLNGFYVRVLINKPNKNNIKFIGSKGDNLSTDSSILNGSYYLNSFSWSLLSDTADESKINEMLLAIDSKLKTEAGFMLCSKHNLKLAGSTSASTDHYFLGDRENGGVFKHATMMFTASLLNRAKTVKSKKLREKMLDDAFYMLDRVLPYKTLESPYVLKGNPRFCTQYNNSITNENIGPILSGTATWLTLTIIEMIGISYSLDSLFVRPELPKDVGYFVAKIKLNNDTYINIVINKPKGVYSDYHNAEYILDGERASYKIPKFDDGVIHELIINF